MAADDLFGEDVSADVSSPASTAAGAPLAVRMRPRTLDEVVGQEHLTRGGGPLQLLVRGSATPSVVLWGPPGTGKTTLAHVVATATGSRFRELSAVTAGVKDVRAEVAEAQRHLRSDGTRTLLFVDEVHRFSKTQQDSLLGPVENRVVTLLAATTENPSFSVVGPLLSRSLLLTLRPLDEAALGRVLDRALTDPRGLGGALTLAPEARAHLLATAGGDARSVLTVLEAAAEAALQAGSPEVDLATLEQAVDRAALRHSRDAHYDVTSAFVKSMRGGDADATLHYLARLIEAGEDPRYIARRIIVHASEDVGLADPTALRSAVAAADALDRVGLPEARIPLAQAALHVALAPKSNAVVRGIDAALADLRAGRGGPVPAHLRDAHYAGAKRQGAGQGYRYPHDDPRGVVRQQHLPDDLVDARYYQPRGAGVEARFAERHAALQQVLRGDVRDTPGTVGPVPAPVAGDARPPVAEQAADEVRHPAAEEA